MTNPIFMNDVPYYYFSCDRNPTADEPVVDDANIPDNMLYYWWNTQTTRIFLPKVREPGQHTWSRILTTDDLVP